ncbi:MAG: SDR family oxidoreductase [Bdellovibrionales bacterium]|nr:SDR family oxidoreductase [Bdellovibrionales bacterium]
MSKEKVLVIGASGTVGSLIVQKLKEKGYQVSAATSKPVKSEEQVQIDLASGQGLKSAFEGVDRAFLISPPGYANQYEILSPLIQEAKRRGLKKVVLMTAFGANADESSPFRRAEVELEKSGLNYNIIRPNWFFQNFSTYWVSGIKEHNKILVPAGTAKVSFIDVRDIASTAVELLTSDEFANRDFDLTGPESLDHDQIAELISKVSGKSVTYEEIKPEVLKEGLLGAGFPEDYVDFMLLIFGYLREGYSADVTDSVKTVLGREAIGFEQYSREFKGSWS